MVVLTNGKYYYWYRANSKKNRRGGLCRYHALNKKADGGKFGKTEQGNVWLDKRLTSPYKFYQFWLNSSDEDVKKYIRIFTLLTKEDIESLETQHDKAPHLRLLQKTLAEDITIRVHSKEDLDAAIKATNILFGKSTSDDLLSLDESTFSFCI